MAKRKIQQVVCESGIIGYQCHLRDSYHDFVEFLAYAETFGLHTRLGYATENDAWHDNPIIQGSAIPSDFKKVE